MVLVYVDMVLVSVDRVLVDIDMVLVSSVDMVLVDVDKIVDIHLSVYHPTVHYSADDTFSWNKGVVFIIQLSSGLS